MSGKKRKSKKKSKKKSNTKDKADEKLSLELECMEATIEILTELRKECGTRGVADAPVDIPNRQRLIDMGQVLGHEVTKFVLFTSKQPEISIMKPACKDICARLTGIVYSLRAMSATAGNDLTVSLQKLSARVVDAVTDVMVQLRGALASGSTDGVNASLTAIVLQRIQEFHKTPLTNVAAVRRVVANQLAAIKDAKRELGTFQCTETDHKVDEEDEQLFLDDENMLSAKEFAAVAPSKQVVGVTLQVVQQLRKSLVGGKFEETVELVGELDKLSTTVQELATAVDELSSSLYSPQDFTALLGNAEFVMESMPAIASFLQRYPPPTSKKAKKASAPAAKDAGDDTKGTPQSSSSDTSSSGPAAADSKHERWLAMVNKLLQSATDSLTKLAPPADNPS